MTVDELATSAGVSVRTLRFYTSKGLLPGPALGPRRVGVYGDEHLARLALIEELQRQGLTLAAVDRYLNQLPDDISVEDLTLHRTLVAGWMPETARPVPVLRLHEQAGRELSDHDLDRLTAMGIIDRTEDPLTVLVNPSLLHLGLRLLDVPIPLETALASREIVLKHTRSLAHELQQLFRDQVWTPYTASEPAPRELERTRALTEHIRPALVQALVTAFQQSLENELRTDRK